MPIQKVIEKKRKFEPFVSASYSTLDIVGVGGGFFYNNLGSEYQYQRSFENKYGHLIGVKVNFRIVKICLKAYLTTTVIYKYDNIQPIHRLRLKENSLSRKAG